MEAKFWHQRWENNEIAFHKDDVNPFLVKFLNSLDLEIGNRIFLPLCGKTLDIAWLLSNGYRVVGVELSEKAIKQLFCELGVDPSISIIGRFKHYSHPNIDIFVGDIFDLSVTILGPTDAIYDRAALVALPKEIRNRYAKHLIDITDNTQQLLLCFEYNQTLMDGPPFSIGKEEVVKHYANNYSIEHIGSLDVDGGLKGICEATENAWKLQN